MDGTVIDSSVRYHGVDLVDRLQDEIPPDQLPNFLTISRKGTKLEQDSIPEFDDRMVAFISKKADILFAKNTVSPKRHAVSDEDLHAALPPLESLLDVSTTKCRSHFFQSVQLGDRVFGVICSIQENGLTVHLQAFGGNQVRDIEQLKIMAFCPVRELPKGYAGESPLESFSVKDKVQGVIIGCDSDIDKLTISLLPHSANDQASTTNKIGLVSDEDFPQYYRLSRKLKECSSYTDVCRRSSGFLNPSSTMNLAGAFGLPEFHSPSLMRDIHRLKLPDSECAESLRKQQCYRWAMQHVEEGVALFKKSKLTEAMQHFFKALQIDPDNVEALVARGCLYANNENYNKALEDFEQALKLNPQHPNARKYLCETLMAHARRLRESGHLEQAIKYLEQCLLIDPQQDDVHSCLRQVEKQYAVKRSSEQMGKGRSKSPSGFDKTVEVLRQLIGKDEKSRKKKKVPTATLR